ncbi:MAG: sodium:calcium antiporter [Candidatus Eisenbacteria bacterium]
MEHLIPQSWFEGLPTAALLLLSAAAIAVLIRGADAVVQGASGLARRLGVSKVVIGATVVSLGTTSPEAAVSVMAAWAGEPGLALGNAVGSIVADTGLIFGLACLLAVLPADRFILRRQGWVQFGAGLLLAAFCYGALARDGDAAALGRGIGLVLLALLVAYLVVSVRWSRRHPGGVEERVPSAGDRGAPFFAALVAGGLLIVILSSRVLICAVTFLAERWGVPQVVIAATLVALGTSLPELVVAMTSIRRGHGDLLVGNVIGADVLNVLFVVGAAAAAAPLPIVDPHSAVPRIFLQLHLPAMIVILGLFRIFIRLSIKRGTFRRRYGVPLVLIYVTYVVAQYVLAAGGPAGS